MAFQLAASRPQPCPSPVPCLQMPCDCERSGEPTAFGLAESPRWSEGRLLFVDITDRRLYCFVPAPPPRPWSAAEMEAAGLPGELCDAEERWPEGVSAGWTRELAAARAKGEKPDEGAKLTCGLELPYEVHSFAPNARPRGGFVAATSEGVVCSSFLSPTFYNPHPHAAGEEEGEGGGANEWLCNDCAVDAKGRFLTGTVRYSPATHDADVAAAAGKLVVSDTDGTVRELDDGAIMSNGLAFDADCSTLYFADSARRTVWRYDYDLETGTVSNKVAHVVLARKDGLPDGLAVDGAGHLWIAVWFGGFVLQVDAQGIELQRLPLPANVTQPTAVAITPEGDVYVTSSADRGYGSPAAHPLAPEGFDFGVAPLGALFVAKGAAATGAAEARVADLQDAVFEEKEEEED